MKKILIIVLTLLLLTGCKSKTLKLKCNKETIFDDMKSNNELILSFESSKISFINQTIKLEINEDTTGNKEAVVKELKEEYETLNKEEGITTKVIEEDNLVVVSSNYDLLKANKEIIKEIFNDDFNETYKIESVKKDFEKDGFKCIEG